MQLTFLIGPSLSGKSYYAEQYKDKEDWVVISSDAVRLQLGFKEYNPQNNNEVFKTVNRKIIGALYHHKNVIYDATNVDARLRQRDINFFKKVFPELNIKAVVFNINPDMLYARSQERDRNQINYVSKEDIDRQLKKFQTNYPKSEEFDEMEIIE